MSVDPQAVLSRVLDDAFSDARPARIGVAVSGGGDSVALLHLAQGWAVGRGVRLHAATVNHGLRPAAAAEATTMATACSALGVGHRTFHWQDRDGQGWDGQGNLQARARQARRTLLSGWAEAAGLEAVLLGHTADDQAETVLMRLARGSGVDGLCGMRRADAGSVFVRPLLAVSRADLRDWLSARGIAWVEDPSNDDLRFDRIKARRLLAELAPLGLTPARLIETAAHMQRAQKTLWQAAAVWTAVHLRAEGGDLVVDAEALQLGRSDTEGRVLAAAVQWIGNAPYRPRHDALQEVAAALRRGEARTLGGVCLTPDGHRGARMSREPAAMAGPVSARRLPGEAVLWDGRWLVSGAAPAEGATDADLTVAALGDTGLAACTGWRGAGLPRGSLVTSPAVWAGGRLIAAPLAGWPNGWQARLCLPFDRFIVSH